MSSTNFEPINERPGWAKRLFFACRPWSAPISTVPVLMGAAIAVAMGAPLRWGRLALTLIGVWLAHAAANLFSDLSDYRRGLDRVVLPVSGGLARGWLSERQTFLFGVACLVASGAIGVWLAALAGPLPCVVAAAGFALGLGYPALKPRAGGDAAVFAAFGPLIALGTWSVFTARFSWLPVLWTSPFGLIVIAVLHANNWRDITADRALGIRSVAGLLGDRGSRRYYGALLFGAYALTTVMIAVPRMVPALGWPAMPWTFLLVFLTLPRAVKLWRRAVPCGEGPLPPARLTLDASTAEFMTPFGATNVLAILLAVL